MKKNLSELFDSFDADELDTLLDNTPIAPLDHKTKNRITQKVLAKIPASQKRRPIYRRKALITLAATLLLFLFVGIGVFAAEQKEYRDALAFFDKYDLSTDSLSRTEIKKVFRDITTESFTYAKTAEVIGNSLIANCVEGYEIIQNNPSPEDVKTLWITLNSGIRLPETSTPSVYYQYKNEYEEGNYVIFDKAYFEKYNGDTLLWRTAIEEFRIEAYTEVSDGVLVCGSNSRTSSLTPSYAYLAKLSHDGKLEWQTQLSKDYQNEFIVDVLENADGTYTVFSRGDFVNLCLNRYTKDGIKQHTKATEIGNYGIRQAKPSENGYLLQLFSYQTNEFAKILKVDYDGTVTEALSYGEKDADYYITDMIEYNGKLYLSAYTTPSLQDGGGRHEIAAILDFAHSNKQWDSTDGVFFTSNELTEITRQNYTALLLVCDSKSGTPEVFYSVKSSQGSTLSVDNGTLVWDVDSIISAFYSPATSSFTIGGTSEIYRYTFNENGALLSAEKTDILSGFRK